MQFPVCLDGSLTTPSQPNIPAGDVVFVLKTKKHDAFERSGNDLLTTVHITLSEALLGFSRILITHLDGRGIQVTSPRGKIIKPGDSIVLRDEGMPIHKSPDQKGNLYIMLEIDMPDEEWIQHVDRTVSSPAHSYPSSSSSPFFQALEGLLPPKKPEMDPRPEVVDEVPFEESDIVDVRSQRFSGSAFFDRSGFARQFGGDEDGWEDEDEDEDDDEDDEWGPHGHEPECQQQ